MNKKNYATVCIKTIVYCIRYIILGKKRMYH